MLLFCFAVVVVCVVVWCRRAMCCCGGMLLLLCVGDMLFFVTLWFVVWRVVVYVLFAVIVLRFDVLCVEFGYVSFVVF